MPAVLVSTRPRTVESEAWFATEAIGVLSRSFGSSGLRLCEACMAPRTFVEDGRITYQTGPVGLDEVVRLDDQSRGDTPPARSAIWLDEHRGGVSVRIVDLRTGHVLFAQNVDPFLTEFDNSERLYTLSEELERRARGDGLTQSFVDFAVFPNPHISMDFADQWGKRNGNLSGVTLSLVDPIVGIGIVHYGRLPFLNTLIGAQGVVSLPTAIAEALGGDVDQGLIDPLLTAVGVLRVPFGRSNYGAVLTVSTNGAFGMGISLMNIRVLPVLL